MKISVITTLKDEANSVDGFLRGLLAQSRTPDEIVIVDGGSTDGTLEAVSRLRQSATVPIRVLEAPGANISEGRNMAIAAAEHEAIAVTDAGTRPNPDWLEKLVAPLEAGPEIAVSSGFFLPGGSGWRQRALAIAITPQLSEIEPEEFLPSSRSVAFRRQWWERVGGYPEWLRHCEDLVFDLDLKSAGASFAFAPDAIVVWDARPNLREFARQYFNYARGDGNAGLWPKRHALRYAAYAIGALAVLRGGRSGLVWSALILGWLGYQGKYLRRLVRIPPSRKRSEQLMALALVPVVVTTGDVAKMVGYVVGRRERAEIERRRAQ